MAKMSMKAWVMAALIALGMAAQAMAADYQWSVPIAGKDKSARAFLWVPPDCKRVRGLLLTSQVILEKEVCDHPAIRAACAKEGLGILQIYRGQQTMFNYNEGADKSLLKILDDLAAESGYSEVAVAPFVTIGHSGGAIGAWNTGYWNPNRTVAMIGLHSAAIMAPSWNPKASVDGIPIMGITGEYEMWGNPKVGLDKHWRWLRGELLMMRGRNLDAQVCEVVQPGAGHFNFDDHLAKVVAMFIQKAAHYRIPADSPASTQPVALNHIPEESGWLTDITFMTPSTFSPTPFKQFKGDSTLAMWHMDEEMARAIEALPSQYGGKTEQRVTFVEDGKPMPAGWIIGPKFQPVEDGMTFKVAGDFLSKTPEGAAGAGVPLSHSNGPIKFKLIGGWSGGGEQMGADTFRIAYCNFGPTDNIQLMAYQEGDAT